MRPRITKGRIIARMLLPYIKHLPFKTLRAFAFFNFSKKYFCSINLGHLQCHSPETIRKLAH